MLKRVLFLNFEIQPTDFDIKGVLLSQRFYLQRNSLTIIFPQRANVKRGISLDFELPTDTYGLFAVLSFCYSLKMNDSFKGFLYHNNKEINKLLKDDNHLDILKTRLFSLKIIATLDGSQNTPAFIDLATWPLMHIRQKNIYDSILNDLLVRLNNVSNPEKIYFLLDYWRRAHDLELIHYGMEAFLNYFKIIESIIGRNSNNKMNDIWIKNKLKILKLSVFTKKVILYRNIRNDYNIGHTARNLILRRNYEHYLNSFDEDIWNHISDISEVSRLLLLISVGIKKYKLIENGGLLSLEYTT